MEKKRRNIILEIFICTTIIMAVLIGYLAYAGDNGIFEIRDLEGERSELAAFSFEIGRASCRERVCLSE